MQMQMGTIEIEGKMFITLFPHEQFVNRIIMMRDRIEYGYIYPITMNGITYEVVITSETAKDTVDFKTEIGRGIHNISLFAQMIEQVVISKSYSKVPDEVYKAVYNHKPYELYHTFVGEVPEGRVYVDSSSNMFVVGEPHMSTSQPNVELPIISAYLYLITETPIANPTSFADIKSEIIQGTPFYINYAVNNVFDIHTRVLASSVYYKPFLDHIGITEEDLSRYVRDKITDNLPKLIDGIDFVEVTDLIESFDKVPMSTKLLVEAISKSENINQSEMKDYIFRYLKTVQEVTFPNN